MRTGIRLLAAVLGWGFISGSATADMLSSLLPAGVPGYGIAPGVTVTSRLRTETESPGIRAGGFMLHPELEEAAGYDSAPFGAGSGGSWRVDTHPSLLVGSAWSRDALGAYFAATNRHYLAAAAQDRTDYTVSLGGSLDIGRDRLTLSAAHLLQHQDRTQLGALFTDRPVAFQLNDARLSYAANAGRWTVTPALQIASFQFGSASLQGLPLDQSYRDRRLLEASLRLDYALAPRRVLLLEVRGLGQHYLHAQPDQPERDATGYQLLAGFADDDGGLWGYRVLAGVESRQFQAAAYRTHTAAIGEAALVWNPSGLTTVTATLTRSMEDAAQEGAAGYTYTAATLRIDHEYRRDVLLHASGQAQRADFLPNGGSQTGYAA
ncbi:MAG TPA: outer membrane beta-barrel protein, partial [Acetobacteraceae bacterium]|nr:outer membrane beta-barrel protein [Acetobacteraceae bacterium]